MRDLPQPGQKTFMAPCFSYSRSFADRLGLFGPRVNAACVSLGGKNVGSLIATDDK